MTDSQELIKDVVCGMVKPKSQFGFSSLFDGRVYYFCSQGDKDLFDAHPEHWIPQEERDNLK